MRKPIYLWRPARRPGLRGWWWSSECPGCGQIVGFRERREQADGSSVGVEPFNLKRYGREYHREPHRCVMRRGEKYQGALYGC